MRNLILFISIFIGLFGFSQQLTWLGDHPASEFGLKQGLREHYSLKPFHLLGKTNDSSINLRLFALPDVAYFSHTDEQLRAMMGFGASINYKSKLLIRGGYSAGLESKDGFYSAQVGTRKPKQKADFIADPRFMLSYRPSKTISLSAGYDELFVGEGSRSMLLSDYGSAYPFAMAKLNFWRFEYSTIYQFFNEDLNGNRLPKFGTSHYLSTSITEWFKLGIFETVIFQSKDTLLNRGYEFEYLNPMIFFRPQEYALGSIDNILLGLDGTIFIGDKLRLYGQLMLDEFSLADIRARNGWWANKFAIQAGMKGLIRKAPDRFFFYRGEVNVVRPFTYSHLSKQLSYSHAGVPLAHPYGSNFAEILAHFSYRHKRFQVDLWNSYSLKGFAENDSVNIGEDVLRPYIDRADDFGHFIGQGQKNHAWRQQFRISYRVLGNRQLNAFCELHWRLNTTKDEPVGQIVLGLRHTLWNDYRNF